MIRRPPRSTRTDTLFPYTTLFRSLPGSGSNHMIPLLSSMPVEGDTTCDPNADNRVCVTAHWLPWRSTTLKCVVQAGVRGSSLSPMFDRRRSEEHTSELQSLMRNSYAVFCLKKKKNSTS